MGLFRVCGISGLVDVQVDWTISINPNGETSSNPPLPFSLYEPNISPPLCVQGGPQAVGPTAASEPRVGITRPDLGRKATWHGWGVQLAVFCSLE